MVVIGGDEGGRTPYLLNAIQALYQLSYTPKRLLFIVLYRLQWKVFRACKRSSGRGQALPALATNSSQDCLLNASRQLSYTPKRLLFICFCRLTREGLSRLQALFRSWASTPRFGYKQFTGLFALRVAPVELHSKARCILYHLSSVVNRLAKKQREYYA